MIIRRIPANYLVYMTMLPFVIDVIFHLEVKLGLPQLFGLPWSALPCLALLALTAVSITFSGPVRPIFDLSAAVFATILASLLALASNEAGLSSMGFYTIILAIMLGTFLLLPPKREAVVQSIQFLAIAFSSLIVLSGVVLLAMPEMFETVHPIRHPWASALPGRILRVEGLLRGPGVFGLFSCFLICISSVFYNKYSLLIVLVGIFGILLSDSRSAILSLGLCEFVIFFHYIRCHGIRALRSSNAKVAAVGLILSAGYVLTLGVPGLMSGSEHRTAIYVQALTDGVVDPSASHPHNFMLAALIQPNWLTSLFTIIASALIIAQTTRACLRGNLVAAVFLLPVLVFSSFEYGIHWSRANLPMMMLLIGLVATRFDFGPSQFQEGNRAADEGEAKAATA